MPHSSETSPLLSGHHPGRRQRGPPSEPPSYRDNYLGENGSTPNHGKQYAKPCILAVWVILLLLAWAGTLVGSFVVGRHSLLSAVNMERNAILNDRRLFKIEKQKWEKHVEADREDLLNDRHLLESEQQKWEEKVKADREALSNDRHRLEIEKQRWNEKRRKEEEAERDEKERRERTRLVWVDLTPQPDCIEYGTRQYSAKLFNVPRDVDGRKWCEETPISIHGHDYPRPEFCTTDGTDYFGHWTVSKGELGCKTYFSLLENESKCVPGVANLRRYVAKLENFQEKDWPRGEALCSSTPIQLHDMVFDHPDRCESWPGWVGVVGVVEVHDESCASRF